MKVSVNWLKELVDTNLSVEDLAHTLTMAGLEVEEITPVAGKFTGIVVSIVKAVAPHPNADKLRVCEVDAGTGTTLQIVCGAPNVVPGLRVPCALVGAFLPGLEIKPAKLRGVESNGMLCSARELGMSEDHSGLLVLAEDAPIGQDIRQYLDLDDVYLSLKMTPNRGDCLSMIGVARDLAAVTGAPLRIPVIPATPESGSPSRGIELTAPNACGRYLGRVITNINADAVTPCWMQRRLERAGFRSIAPLVDITNYLTLERGRPMHAFDNAKLQGEINVRFAKTGETINLLNGQHIELQPDMLLISDMFGPIALGGVMGGLESMCTRETKSVFFEAAYFNPAVIQGKTRTLGINSDAAYRFERGVDPDGAREGIEYATQLAVEICGTSSTEIGPIVEAKGELPPRSPIHVRPERVERLIGMSIPHDEIVAIFKRLQCTVVTDGNGLAVTPPSYRFDLTIEEEFIEEIARIFGYDKIPAVAPTSSLPMMSVPEGSRSCNDLRHLLANHGYQEVINYSFVPETWEADLAGNELPLRLANPIASHLGVMRSSLIGGLIASLRHNLNHGETRAKLFEIGRCFLEDKADMAFQPERLAGVVYGARFPEQWGEGGQKGPITDFYAVKGELELFLEGREVHFEKCLHTALHPGRAARIVIDGTEAGIIGELHPKWQVKYEVPLAPIIFELDIQSISSVTKPAYLHFSRMQSVRRDVAFLVGDAVEIQAMVSTVLARKIPSIVEFALFDIYRGQNVESGKKSVAFRIVMQDTDRTLIDSEADRKVAEIVEVICKEFGATLRK